MRDSRGFDEFYRGSSARMVRYAYALTGDLGDAQDVVQEAYTRAWRHWRTVSGRPAPEGWIRLTRSARARHGGREPDAAAVRRGGAGPGLGFQPPRRRRAGPGFRTLYVVARFRDSLAVVENTGAGIPGDRESMVEIGGRAIARLAGWRR